MTTHELERTRSAQSSFSENSARRTLLAKIPVMERRLQLAGVSTAVLEGGDGPPLVLLHGGIECGGVYWGPVISRLAQSHHLVIPDVPGLGESDPTARLDAVTFADWFTALLQTTCQEKSTLIAHSLLGSMVSRFAAQRGDLLRHLVIYGAPGIGPYRMPLGLMVAAILLDLRPTERNSERFERWAFLDLERTRQRDPEWFDAFRAYSLARAIVPHVKRTMRQLIKIGTRQITSAELQLIKVPTSLLWGRHDRMAPLRLAEAASSKFGWPLHAIDDAGHVPHIEQPEGFLRGASAAQKQTPHILLI
jgi:pimeloyl-ACP methyl ester carboxylesterase